MRIDRPISHRTKTAPNMPSPAQPAIFRTLLVFGASGHGRVVADAARVAAHWDRVLASDRDGDKCHGLLLPGVAVVDADQASQLDAMVHVAIGNNVHRQREVRAWMQAWGVGRLASVVHPRACVSTAAGIGSACFIAAGAVLAPCAEVGEGCIINHGAVVDHDVRVEGFSHVAPRAVLGGGVIVGQRVLVGAGAVVKPGLRIADDVVIGAGAVVLHSILEPGTYVGVPARRLS